MKKSELLNEENLKILSRIAKIDAFYHESGDELTQFQQFIYDILSENLKVDGYKCEIDHICKFEYYVNGNLFRYLFGTKLGSHLADKYALECNRNLLLFFGAVTDEIKYFIIWQINTNKSLYVYCN